MPRQAKLDALLASYPRRRPDLPEAHRASYVEHYRANRSGANGVSSIAVKLESWMHRRVAAGVTGGSILELGAGTLNHVRYHPDAAAYDAVEPFRELWEACPEQGRIRSMYADLTEVSSDQYYDCVLSVAVLEHLTDLPFLLARSALHLAAGGTFRAGFPSEGGLLWGLAWRFTTGIEYRLKRGLDYAAIMRHEHVNTAAEILTLLDFFYENVTVERFPLPFVHLSFYAVAIARNPRLDRCRKYAQAKAQKALRA